MTHFQTPPIGCMTFEKSKTGIKNSKAACVSLHVTDSYIQSVPKNPMPVNGKTAAGPLTPTLAANCRAPNRQTPQTPRLASTATLSHGSSTTRSTNISAEKRFQGSSINSELPRSGTAGTRKNKDGPSTPVRDIPTAATTAATLLGGNVTPRSSARKSRTDSNKSTPNNTPTGTSTPGLNSAKERAVGVDIHHDTHETSSQNVVMSNTGSNSDFVGNSPKLHLVPSSSISSISSSASPITTTAKTKFFYANDASKCPTTQKIHERPALRKAATFYHTSGAQESISQAQTKSVCPNLSAIEREAPPLSKFCHVDETKSSRSAISSPPSLTSSPASSTFASPTQPFPSLRSPSPLKENIHLSYRKGVSQVIRPACHRLSAASLPAFAGRSTPTNNNIDGDKANEEVESLRRMSSPSNAAMDQTIRMKRTSLSSIDSGTPTKSVLLGEEASQVETPSMGIDIALAKPSLSSLTGVVTDENAQQLQKGNNNRSEGSQLRSDSKGLPLLSPLILNVSGEQQARITSNVQTKSADVAELAANARRERKVLDLEISNSSLLAINRQLEREVRKQKVELRRFRRLSRAGHISLGRASSSSFAAKRCISCSTTVTDLDEQDETKLEYQDSNDRYLNENEFGDSEDGDEDDEEDSSASDLSSITYSSKPYTDRRIARDERRLRLDLSKHRELLVDSQKLNQGLRRCVDWTEELVRDGRRALDYKVRVSDVKLGGRVLRSEDDQLPDDEIEVEDKWDGDVCENRIANVEADDYHEGDTINRGDEVTGSVDACENADEATSGSSLLSPWRSRTGVELSQQHTAETLPVISDYFGSEVLSGIMQSENTMPA